MTFKEYLKNTYNEDIYKIMESTSGLVYTCDENNQMKFECFNNFKDLSEYYFNQVIETINHNDKVIPVLRIV